MAYRRSIITRAKLLAQQRYSQTFAYMSHDDDRKKHDGDPKLGNFLQRRSFGGCGGFTNTSLAGFRGGGGALFQDRMCIFPGSLLGTRHMSTTIGEGAGVDKIDYMTDVAEVIADKTVEAVITPGASEVAVAAADSFLPVAALQYFIDGVHNLTGLNWWASIVITTLFIRTLTVPLMINQLKATSKLTLMRPRLEEIKQEMQDRGMSPTAVAEGQQRMQEIFKGHGVTPFTPLKGLLIQGPVFLSFFLAIQNMVEKVPSFKNGGAFWFTDLTTPDSMYILPVLTALSFWIVVECNMQEGMEGNPTAGTMKNISRGFAALSVPLTMSFPKAIFCYWITSNMFSLTYGLMLKAPGVKKFLRIPILPVAPPTANSKAKPAFSFFEALNKYAAATAASKRQSVSSPVLPSSTEALKTANQPRISSSSVLSQRIKSLEKEVKGRKKGKKR